MVCVWVGEVCRAGAGDGISAWFSLERKSRRQTDTDLLGLGLKITGAGVRSLPAPKSNSWFRY